MGHHEGQAAGERTEQRPEGHGDFTPLTLCRTGWIAARNAGDYRNIDGSCGGSPDLAEYDFEILAAGTKPGQADPAKPGKGKANTPDNKPQGTTATTPLNPTTGTLAATGSSSATSKLALAGGAAVVAGAGALLAVRRRRTDG
ncbi:LPXTG cell wall anchor domain-containing protein [Streptomyces sp. NPDC059994]|uniref:LPXTG cell wall anchor domain-containing protein n=1 Tax=Streptomyces sp. NPDC059994 TaxID=3347029 RepID=UPI0036961991